MKKLMCTVAAVFLAAFTMNAQTDADAAAVKTTTKTEEAKPVVKAVQVQDSDVVKMQNSSTTTTNSTTNTATKPVSRATIIENEKAEKAAKAKKAVKKDN